MQLRPRILIPVGLLVLICAGLIAFRTLSAPKLPETLRPFPYPYTAMLALQSHIDGTTPEEYEAVHAYLNGRENTVYGDGLSMDVGDSLWLYADNNGVSYRTGDTRDISEYMTWYNGLSDEENDADLIREGVQKGWIDSMHTYGDFSRVDTEDVTFTRELAERAIRTLQDNDIYMKIWINHGNEANRQNFGGWLPFLATSYQAGSDPDSAWYHTDLLLDYGIRYLWNSHNSGRFGQTDPLFIITLRDGSRHHPGCPDAGQVQGPGCPATVSREDQAGHDRQHQGCRGSHGQAGCHGHGRRRRQEEPCGEVLREA